MLENDAKPEWSMPSPPKELARHGDIARNLLHRNDKPVRTTFRLTTEAVQMFEEQWGDTWGKTSHAIFFDIIEDSDLFPPPLSETEGFFDYVRQIQAARDHAPTIRKTLALSQKRIRHYTQLAKEHGVARDCIVEATIRMTYENRRASDERRLALKAEFETLLGQEGYELLERIESELGQDDLLWESLNYFLNVRDQLIQFLDGEDPSVLPF